MSGCKLARRFTIHEKWGHERVSVPYRKFFSLELSACPLDQLEFPKPNVVLRRYARRDSSTLDHRKGIFIRNVYPTPPRESLGRNLEYSAALDGQHLRKLPGLMEHSYINIQTVWRWRHRKGSTICNLPAKHLGACYGSSTNDTIGVMNQPDMTALKTRRIIQEILENEKNYVANLMKGICDYIRPLDSLLLPNTLKGRRVEIFSNIEVIYEFHKRIFLPQLVECNFNPTQIANVFVKFVESCQFYMYNVYILNRKWSEKVCRENQYFFKQLEKDHLGIHSFLLQPVQRLPRYQLLLNKLIRNLIKDPFRNKNAIARCFVAERSVQKLLNLVNQQCD